MHNVKYWIRVLHKVFLLSVQEQLQFRMQILVWIFSDLMQPIIFAVLWSTVLAVDEGEGALRNQVILYYFVAAAFVKVTQDYTLGMLMDGIVTGGFSKYLVRPLGYVVELVAINISHKLVRLLLMLPFLVLGYFMLHRYFEIDLKVEKWFLVMWAIFVAIMVNFLMAMLFAFVAFFIKQFAAMKIMYLNLIMVLSGEYIPLILIPERLYELSKYFPFRYMLSFPVELALGFLVTEEILKGFAFGFGWILILGVSFKLFSSRALRRYEAEGI